MGWCRCGLTFLNQFIAVPKAILRDEDFHLIFPMTVAPLGKFCPHCYSENLRRSKLRYGDLGLLLTLRYPLRCEDCRERPFTFVWRAFALDRLRAVIR